MKKHSKLLVFSIMLTSFIWTVSSQDTPPQPLRLSISEAQDYALKNNKTVWNAGLSVSEAQKKTWETISAGLPQVNASVDYSNMMGFKMEFAGMSIALQPTSNFQATVSQLLLNASYWVGIKMSRIGEQMTETLRLQTELDVKQQTKSSCHNILIAEESRKILEQSLENIRTLAKKTEDMVRIGVVEQTDADRVNLQVITMINAIANIDRNIELAYNLLRFQLGVLPDTPVELTQTLDELITANDANETLSAAFDLNTNYNMQLLEGQVDIAEMTVNLQRAAIFPTVAAFYNYTYKIAKSAFDMSPNNVIGLQASIPIFASGQRHVKTQQAKINLEIAQNNREMIADQLLIQEKQLRIVLKSAIETLELQKEAVSVSQRVFESVSRKYEQGTASSFELTSASTELLQAQGNYISAMQQVFAAQAELEKLLNTL